MLDYYLKLSKCIEFVDGKPMWNSTVSNKKLKGKVAGSLNTSGYRQLKVSIGGVQKRIVASKVAWFIHYGYVTELELDHINRDRDDNRIENLREVSRSQNQRNRLYTGSVTSKYRGVSWHRKSKKWVAQIKIDGETKYLGSFSCELEARDAYVLKLDQLNLDCYVPKKTHP